ncbi:hypothetical protein ACPB9E_21915 [Streptomyces exfoliatus]|uniref:hypothetical protein n=1 Tax=Streptomyces exfoliatus TaxID=1905 RepID=UPI003C30620F
MVPVLRFPLNVQPQACQFAPQALLLSRRQAKVPDLAAEHTFGDHAVHGRRSEFGVEDAQRIPESSRILLATSCFPHGHPSPSPVSTTTLEAAR